MHVSFAVVSGIGSVFDPGVILSCNKMHVAMVAADAVTYDVI
jgi:hypothetical protein